MKIIIAIAGATNTGKSSVLREFANILLAKYSGCKLLFPVSSIPPLVPPIGDFRLVIEINSKIIGIENSHKGLKGRLVDLSRNHQCDIIVCSIKSKGPTVDAVRNIWNSGFQQILTSTYQTVPNQDLANQTKARHLLDLLQQLKLL